MIAGGGEDVLKLLDVDSGRLFAEDMLPGCESLDAEVGVRVWVGGYIDGVYMAVEKSFECRGHSGDGKFIGIGSGAIGVTPPDGDDTGVFHRLQTVSKARCCTTWPDDAPSN